MTENLPLAWLKKNLPAVLAGLLLLAAVSPLLMTIRNVSRNDDFLQLAARHHLLRNALLKEGGFPLRTQFLNGGFPTLGDPEDPSLSPFAALTLAFGEVAGLKLIALLLFAAGCASMYLMLLRVSGLGREAAAFGAALYGLSGWFITRLYGGNINELYFFLAPGFIVLFEGLAAGRDKRLLFFSSLLLAAVAMDGKAVFLCLLLFLGFYAAARSFGMSSSGPRLAPIGWFLAIACLAGLFAAAKIVPVLELFNETGSAARPVLSSHSAVYGDVVYFGLKSFLQGLVFPLARDRAVSLYLGWVPAGLFLAGAVFRPRRSVTWLVAGVVFYLLWAGPAAPVDLLALLWKLPFFGTISQPHKYFDIFILLCMCAVAAAGYELAGQALRGRPLLSASLRAVLALASLAPLLIFCFPKYRTAFPVKQEKLGRTPEFFQVFVNGGSDGSAMYYNAVQGVGTINWYGAIVLPTAVIPRYFSEVGKGNSPNPGYTGEAWCTRGDSRCGPARFRANRIAAVVETAAPDRLVLNQNYDPRWRSGDGRVVDHGGLLALELAPAGRRLAALEYRPYGFYAGAALSLLSLAAAFLFCFGFLKRGAA